MPAPSYRWRSRRKAGLDFRDRCRFHHHHRFRCADWGFLSPSPRISPSAPKVDCSVSECSRQEDLIAGRCCWLCLLEINSCPLLDRAGFGVGACCWTGQASVLVSRFRHRCLGVGLSVSESVCRNCCRLLQCCVGTHRKNKFPPVATASHTR